MVKTGRSAEQDAGRKAARNTARNAIDRTTEAAAGQPAGGSARHGLVQPGHGPGQMPGPMMDRRDFLIGAGATGVAASLVGALPHRSAAAQTPQRGGTLIWGVAGGGPRDSLDPATYTRQPTIFAGKTWGETLVEPHPSGGDPVPVLAESWTSTPDAKTWTFKIRKGVKFHDGREMTAEDAVATLERHLDPRTKSGALGMLRDVVGIRAEAGTLVIDQREPNADLPYLLANHHLIIQPNGGKDNPSAAIGTGPYKLAEFKAGDHFLLERVRDHWRENVGFFDSVMIRVINDETTRIATLLDGHVHVIDRVNPKLVTLLARAPNMVIERTAGRGYAAFLMHCNTPPFNNPDLRLALKLAMNRQDMIDRILRGNGRPGNDFPVNEAYPLYPNDIEARVHDPEKANFYYKKSGHGEPILLRTSEAAFPGAVEAARLYRRYCAQAGIDLRIKVERPETYWSEVWNRKPFCTAYWRSRPVQDQMYATAYHSTADWNDTRWFRKDFDTLLMQARKELDNTKRRALYTKMATMVRNDGGLILPMFDDFIDARHDRLMGYTADVNGANANGFIGIRGWFAA